MKVVNLTASHPKVVHYSQKVVHYPNFDPAYLTNGWEFGDETYTARKLRPRRVLECSQIRVTLRSGRTPYILQ